MKMMPEDLMQTVIAADAIRRKRLGERRMRFARWKRIWIEPVFNLMGSIVGQLLVMLPWPLYWRAVQRINQAMGGRSDSLPSSFSSHREEIGAMAARLHHETGQ